MENTNITTSMVYYVNSENELRFFIGGERTVTLELLDGFAEIFGSQLVLNKSYTFLPYSSVSLFSWQGCSVKLTGRNVHASVTPNIQIMFSVNVHACLEEMRIVAELEKKRGPISLVVGPTQSGKSSLCRFLLNYASRLGRKPLYVDLDVEYNQSSIPGAISILPVENHSHLTEGFVRNALSVYVYGYLLQRENIPLYYLLIKSLGDMIHERMSTTNPKISHSGVIIDTGSWVRSEGYTALTVAAYAFQIDVLFVIKDESLYLQLKRDLPSSVKVVFVPQQDIKRNPQTLRSNIQADRLRQYFYGSIQDPVIPYKIELKFSDADIYCADSLPTVANAYNISVKDIRIICVRFGPELINSVLGLSYADEFDENLLITNVKGFVCVDSVDMKKNVLTVLSPQPAPLHSKIFIMTNMKLR